MNLFVMALASLSAIVSVPALADPGRTRQDAGAVAPALEKYRQGTLLGDV